MFSSWVFFAVLVLFVYAWFSTQPISLSEFLIVMSFHFQVPVKEKESPPQVKEALVKPAAPQEGTQLLFKSVSVCVCVSV